METPCFPKQVDGKKRTGRSTANHGNAIVVLELEAFPLRRGAEHGLSQFANNVGAVPAAHGRPLRGNYSILVRRIIAGILRLGCPGSS
jgi:hypothetical protein